MTSEQDVVGTAPGSGVTPKIQAHEDPKGGAPDDLCAAHKQQQCCSLQTVEDLYALLETCPMQIIEMQYMQCNAI